MWTEGDVIKSLSSWDATVPSSSELFGFFVSLLDQQFLQRQPFLDLLAQSRQSKTCDVRGRQAIVVQSPSG
ncbi:hypothetical protein [Enterococcus hirae]|uniref:hypothetical protein n=1 Tax=Enterococcus hirae TaxID=1354 RepID=UPI0019634634|nr:hypothetical protein [Enterococcus hirae]